MSNVANSGSKWIRPAKRQAIYHRDGDCCIYCGRDANDETVRYLTLDHVLAQSMGGTNKETNLVTCCNVCNTKKGALSEGEWLAVLRYNGVDTVKLPRRIRRQLNRPLDMVEGRRREALRRELNK